MIIKTICVCISGLGFAMAKSIFARTVEKTGKNWQKLEYTKLYRNNPIWVINEIF